ncbi:MAG TPA: MarR family transcriptional regulator [Thermomicrobiaceae bacterium]|nr:MarR family transcriptional regulator [Thermomicrobiaceae bacterium]
MTATVLVSDQQDPVADATLAALLRRVFIQLQPGPESLADWWPNLTMQQLRVMRILYGDGPTRVSVLARRLHVSTPTVTGILDRLVRQGLTYRADDPRDRRVVLNDLTDQGRAVIEQFHPMNAELTQQIIAQLGPVERNALAQGLAGLLSDVAPHVN